MPRNAAEAKGLLLASIRDPDPVIFFEPKILYRTSVEQVPDGDYEVPLGTADVMREGTDVTLVRDGEEWRRERGRKYFFCTRPGRSHVATAVVLKHLCCSRCTNQSTGVPSRKSLCLSTIRSIFASWTRGQASMASTSLQHI